MISAELSFGLGEDSLGVVVIGVISLEVVGVMKKERKLRSDGAFQILSGSGTSGAKNGLRFEPVTVSHRNERSRWGTV